MPPRKPLGVVAGVGVFVLHRANLGRLWRGEESRAHLRKPKPKPRAPNPSASL